MKKTGKESRKEKTKKEEGKKEKNYN